MSKFVRIRIVLTKDRELCVLKEDLSRVRRANITVADLPKRCLYEKATWNHYLSDFSYRNLSVTFYDHKTAKRGSKIMSKYIMWNHDKNTKVLGLPWTLNLTVHCETAFGMSYKCICKKSVPANIPRKLQQRTVVIVAIE